MFNGGSKGQTARPTKRADAADNAVTILTNGCHFSGKLYCTGSTRIGGTIEGEIVSEGVLIIEEKAEIKASITAEEVIVQGLVEGRLESKQKVEICHSGRFKGDVFTPSLVIREGARFNGRSMMDDQPVLTGAQLDEAASEPPEVSPRLDVPQSKADLEVSLL